jgi:hypothetical protein
MLKSLKLHGVGPVKDLSASFGERLNVLTGDNGLGKSFLLDVAFWALTGSWPGGRVAIPEPTRNNDRPPNSRSIPPGGRLGQRPEPNRNKDSPRIIYQAEGRKKQLKTTASYDYHTQSWSRDVEKPLPCLVVYAAVDGSFAVWDPARNYLREGPSGRAEPTEEPRPFQFSPEALRTGIQLQDRALSDGLVRDWVRWYDRRAAKPAESPFELLEQVIARLAHPEEKITPGKPRRVFVDETLEYPTLEMPYGNAAYPHWPAGVRRMVSLAYLLVWTWHEHARAAHLRQEQPAERLVVLVDEIEAHLHPKWQRTILPALLGAAEGLRAPRSVQVLVATHSPLVLASLEPIFDEDKDRLFCFDLEGQTVHFRPYPWAKQGDVVGWLTSDIFGLKEARSREAEAAIQAAEAFMRGDTNALPEKLKTKAQINKELRRVLPGHDPFWPRWLVRTEKTRA